MPSFYSLKERLTFKFVPGWSHEDKWRHLMRVKVLRGVSGIDETTLDEFDLPPLKLTVQLPSGLTARLRRRLKRAAVETFSGSSCRHEYDCCGCVSRDARVVHTSRRQLHLLVRRSRNY